MGIGAVRDLAVIEEIDSDDLSGQTVSVDAHNWLYKYMIPTVQYTDTRAYTNEDGDELPAVLGLLQGLKRFYKNDITPVFVYDGSAHDLKAEEIARRKAKKEEAKDRFDEQKSEGNIIEAAREQSRASHLNGAMIAATQRILDVLNIPVIEAHGAGEAQAAYMAADSDVITAIVSDDYDSLLFGAPVVIRNFSSSEPHERLRLDELLEENSMTQEQLIWFALLCGTDYNNGAYGYGPKTAASLVIEEDEAEIRGVLLENDEDLTSEQLDIIFTLFTEYQKLEDYPEPAGFEAVAKASLENVVYDEIGLKSEKIEKAVDSLAEEIPQNSNLSSWG